MVFKTDYYLMQVKCIAECSKRAFCNTFTFIELTFVFKTFILSIFEWLLKTGFTVCILPIDGTNGIEHPTLHSRAKYNTMYSMSTTHGHRSYKKDDMM